ncbi:hypothetical protein BT96DRAFT_929953 [Gymnopus androsaceus JB14]|uniref:Uncharacterized protein n=1 Tax=Gymnopus androsaceus JB14 TaxID=1447944 RepID=A0A6A4GCM2_9AGAR|nr:hypothetical protein BT96DRAFT_929953 [Gymnopus androsaceus JB14]
MNAIVNLFSTMGSELSTAPSLPRDWSQVTGSSDIDLHLVLSGYKYWLVRVQIAIASSLEKLEPFILL